MKIWEHPSGFNPSSIPRTEICQADLDPNSNRQQLIAMTEECASWIEEAARTISVGMVVSEEAFPLRIGLLVRVTKMLRRQAEALGDDDDEAAWIFSRCAFESVLQLSRLIVHPEDASSFKREGLRLEKWIQDQVDPGESHEANEAVRFSDLSLDSVGGSIHEINFRELLAQSGIVGIQESQADPNHPYHGAWIQVCQAVHGSWRNLQEFHLHQSTELDWLPTLQPRFQGLLPCYLAIFAIPAILQAHPLKSFGALPKIWEPRMKDLTNRLEIMRVLLLQVDPGQENPLVESGQ